MNFSCFSVEILTESVPHHRPSLVLFGDNARTASSPKDIGNSGSSNFPKNLQHVLNKAPIPRSSPLYYISKANIMWITISKTPECISIRCPIER